MQRSKRFVQPNGPGLVKPGNGKQPLRLLIFYTGDPCHVYAARLLCSLFHMPKQVPTIALLPFIFGNVDFIDPGIIAS